MKTSFLFVKNVASLDLPQGEEFCVVAPFVHSMALFSKLSISRFSCEHEICSQQASSELE